MVMPSNRAILAARCMDGTGPGISTSLRASTRTADRYDIRVFTDILEFVNYMEGFGVNWKKAAEYASNNGFFIFAPEERSDVVLGIYTAGGKHGVLEIYEMEHPSRCDSMVAELIGRVEDV